MIIYSFKILFASFHLKNSAVSGCVFSLPVASTLLFKVNSFSIFGVCYAWYIFAAPFTYVCFLMSLPQDRNSNSNSVLFERYECHCVNYFWLHKQWIRDFFWMCQYLKRKASLITLTSTYSSQMTLCSIFGVRCLSWLVMTFIKDKVRYGLMASLSISAQQRQSHIYLPPLPQSFVCNLPDSWRHLTVPNQVLSTGRGENLRTRLKLVWPPVKKACVVPSSFRFSFCPCSPFTLQPTSRLKFALENIKQLI